VGAGWSQLAPAQGADVPGRAGDALMQQRLERIVQLISRSAASPPGAKTPSSGTGYAGLAACPGRAELGPCWGGGCCSLGCPVSPAASA